MTKLQIKVAALQTKADELAEQLLALMDELPIRDPERKTLTTEYSYEEAAKQLAPIVERVGKLGASQEYWESPEGKSVKRDCATLRRALAICQAGGPGLVGRLANR